MIHEVLCLNVTHHYPTSCIPMQIVSVHLFTCPDVIYIANDNSLTPFGTSRLGIDPVSYTFS